MSKTPNIIAILVGLMLFTGAALAEAHIIPCGTYDPNYGYGQCDAQGKPIVTHTDPGTPGGNVYVNYGNSNANNTNSSACQNSGQSGAGFHYDPVTGTYNWRDASPSVPCQSGSVNANSYGYLPWGTAMLPNSNYSAPAYNYSPYGYGGGYSSGYGFGSGYGDSYAYSPNYGYGFGGYGYTTNRTANDVISWVSALGAVASLFDGGSSYGGGGYGNYGYDSYGGYGGGYGGGYSPGYTDYTTTTTYDLYNYSSPGSYRSNYGSRGGNSWDNAFGVGDTSWYSGRSSWDSAFGSGDTSWYR